MVIVKDSPQRLLEDAMKSAGFSDYAAEWWHYTLDG
jgi:D-alanyl-D-alanine dipeptidase